MDRPIVSHSSIVDVEFGPMVKVQAPVNLYGCTIGANSFVGPFVEIQSNVVIGSRVRVQSHAFICSFVRIGNDCFISHGAMFVNDDFKRGGPAGGDQSLWRETILGDSVSVGTNATILPVQICSNVVIGAGSVVTKDITRPGIYAGNPAIFLRDIEEL